MILPAETEDLILVGYKSSRKYLYREDLPDHFRGLPTHGFVNAPILLEIGN